MDPRQFQQHQQQVNETASRYLATNFGYQSQNGISQDYALGQNFGNQLSKQTSAMNARYSNFATFSNTQPNQYRTGSSTPSSSSSLISPLTMFQNIRTSALQRSTSQTQSLPWGRNISSNSNQQIFASAPKTAAVQQTLNQLGIHSSVQSNIHPSTMQPTFGGQTVGVRNIPVLSQSLQRTTGLNRSSSVPGHQGPSPGSSPLAMNTQQSSSRLSQIPHSLPQFANQSPQPIPHSVGSPQVRHHNMGSSPVSMLSSNTPISITNSLLQKSTSVNQSVMPSVGRRDKIHIRFQPSPPVTVSPASDKQTQSQQRKRSVPGFTDASSNKEDGPSRPKQKLVLNETRIVIDDDIEIVGSKEAEIMSHIRADCPRHKFARIDSASQPPDSGNQSKCDKCFCYICDKLATECSEWTNPSCPHCNAHPKSSCWKARRNMKKSPLMNLLTAEDITPAITEAGEMAMKYTIQVRETYITYRAGTPCDFDQVPCDCACHSDSTRRPMQCHHCKAIHDLKKKFNYEPVRKIVYQLIDETAKYCETQPHQALVLLEALLSELCSHRPADFNHFTRRPSNPDVRCQCTTPQIMDERIEPLLIKIFTANEIEKSFKDKFMKCVKASVEPLQLTDVMKRFFNMRHWEDLLLRAVLSGQNTNGRGRGNNALKETPQIVKMRVKKLDKEKRYQHILRYVKAVTVIRPSKYADELPTTFVESWIVMCLAKLGKFKEACMHLLAKPNLLQYCAVDYLLNLFTCLSEKDPSLAVNSSSSFNNERGGGATLRLAGMDRTALLLLFIAVLKYNQSASTDKSCYVWLARWVNTQKLSSVDSSVPVWISSASRLIDVAKTINVSTPDKQRRDLFTHNCRAQDDQVYIFACSLLVADFLSASPSHLDAVEEIRAAYEINEWALFHLFSDAKVLPSGNRFVVKWLTNYIQLMDCSLTCFDPEALCFLVDVGSWEDVFPFVKTLLSGDWRSFSLRALARAVKVSSDFASRILKNPDTASDAVEFLSNVVLGWIKTMNLHDYEDLRPLCGAIARVCCLLGSINHLDFYKQVTRDGLTWQNNAAEIFKAHENRFSRNLKSPEEVACLLRYAFKEKRHSCVRSIFAKCTDNHVCTNNTSALVMDEVIQILNDPTATTKSDIIVQYTKLCAHETLSWLICAACSDKMPDRWVNLWLTLYNQRMQARLEAIVRHTLQQFNLWMKELCVREESDVKRLLRCLNIFVGNVATTLIKCRFAPDNVKHLLLETRHVIADTRLQMEFQKIVNVALPPEDVAPPPERPRISVLSSTERVLGQAPAGPPRTTASNVVGATAASTSQTDAALHSSSPSTKSSPPVLDSVASRAPFPSSNHLPPSSNRVPPVSSNSAGPSGATASGDRASSLKDSTSTGVVPQAASDSPKSLPHRSNVATALPPSQAQTEPSAPSVCPQCGDAMSSSFRCSACHALRNHDVTCPSCGQVNANLTGYSCRFCYTSLLGVLTSNEPPAQTRSSPASSSEEKKSKKKKKKLRKERSADRPAMTNREKKIASSTEGSDVSENVGSGYDDVPASRALPQGDGDGQPRHVSLTIKRSLSLKAKTGSMHAKLEAPLKLRLSKDTSRMDGDSTQKIRAKSYDAQPVSSVPVRTAFSPHRIALSPNRPSSETSSPNRTNHLLHRRPSSGFHESSPTETARFHRERAPSQDKSRHSSSGESGMASPGLKVPPLVLKRTADERSSDHATSSPIAKKTRTDQPSKAAANKGLFMSKQQRNILHRIKNTNKKHPRHQQQQKQAPCKATAVVKHPLPPKVAAWEVPKQRRPGPASRTSFYSINPHWNIPRHLHLPYRTHLPKVCRVQLSLFPPNIMEMIHDHQPDLVLKSLFA